MTSPRTTLRNLSIFRLPEDKREQMHLESAIVSIELHSSGEELLLGYAGGTAIVAQPQVVPDPANASPATAGDANADVAAALTDAPAGDVPTTNGEIEEATPAEAPQPAVPTTTEEQAPAEAIEETPATPSAPQQKKSKTGERHVAANLQAIRAEATKKFRTLSKTIKNKIEKTDHSKSVEVQVSLPVPPSPRVLRLLPYTQALSCATWRVTSADLEIAATQMELEVLVAYDDGAHLTWKVPKTVSGEGEEEPIIAVNQEVASIPYGEFVVGFGIWFTNTGFIALFAVIRTPSVWGDSAHPGSSLCDACWCRGYDFRWGPSTCPTLRQAHRQCSSGA